jgi:predicted MPP superfamily phosphohydrolase
MTFQIREESLPILALGASTFKILHFSDLHLTPKRQQAILDIKSWSAFKPDLVIGTGDYLAHKNAVSIALEALDQLLNFPGLYVFGSNDYYGPRFKNPLSYLRSDDGERRLGEKLPIEKFDSELKRRGWINLNNSRSSIKINGIKIDVRGTDDAHLELDDYKKVAGSPSGDLSIGVTHAPYKRVLDAMGQDGLDLIFAGHTHGGQVRLPCFGGSRSLTTNCDLPNWRSRGLTRNENGPWLNVSAGMGYSPFAPFRLFCPSEVSLITLTSS